ncbi:MAG: DUF512 domain-containing protein [Clostridia bacterium]|nr:DUF512 domain-containing protein [Clostridia bacterium]
MNKADTSILDVEKNSLAAEAGIEPGDILLSVNGHEIHDILEYKFLTSEYEVELCIQKKNGEIQNILIECDYEDPGLIFTEELLCEAQSCRNKCIFCFIDQLPPGMRETVYFKDDDTRLSFLQGNYVTMTNMTDDEIDRLISMRVSPINISVHTTNPELREFMLNNRFAGKILDIMKKLADNNIHMNCQIVLCPGINDEAELERSLTDLAALFPCVESISVVPVGVTAYRDGLYKLKTFDSAGSAAVIDRVERLQKKFLEALGSRIVYLSDEFYMNSGRPVPGAECYEGFPQLENGVGLIASMEEEVRHAVTLIKRKNRSRTTAVATGEIAYPFIRKICTMIENKAPGVRVNVYTVKNTFFGGGVTVAGLICGTDLVKTLSGIPYSGEVLISSSMLKCDEDIFLDDMTVADVETKTGMKLIPTDNDGYVFTEHILGEELEF